MKIDKTELSKKIGQLKGIVPKQTTIPALQGVLVKDGYLIAANNELTVKAKLEGIDGELFIIPAKAFDLISSLPSGEVTIVCEKEVVTIQMGKIKNNFKTLPAESFIFSRESMESNGNASIPVDKLKEAISHVIYAIPSGGANQMMTGMYLETENGVLNFVGLDGHRVAWDSINYSGDIKMIVPRAAVDKIQQLDLRGDVSLAFDKNGAVFKSDEYEIYTRLIEGNYFPYRKMFSDGEIITAVDRKLLLEAINRARLCGAMEDKAPVMLQLQGALLNITYKNMTADYAEEVPLQSGVGTGLKIAFDPKLLLDCLKAFSCENLSLSVTNKKMPMIIKADDSDMTALVLPVNFNE